MSLCNIQVLKQTVVLAMIWVILECCSTFKLCSCNLWHCCYQCYFVLHSYISQNNVAEECFSTSSTCLPSTTHTTQKNSPKKFSVKLLRTLVQRIVHPSCAAQPTQHKKNSPQILHSNCYYDVSFARVRAAQPEIPLKISPLKIAGTYHLPEFAWHNPRNKKKIPSKFPVPQKNSPQNSPLKLYRSSSRGTTTQHKKIPLKNSGSSWNLTEGRPESNRGEKQTERNWR